jgi:hypothetical protein
MVKRRAFERSLAADAGRRAHGGPLTEALVAVAAKLAPEDDPRLAATRLLGDARRR